MRKKVLLFLFIFSMFMASLGFTSPVQAQADGAYGGTLKIAISDDPHTLSIFFKAATIDKYVLWPIYDPLVVVSPDNEIIPWLAESWEKSQDGLHWTFHLVRNATWHDGKPFTAHDVKFTFDIIIDYQIPTKTASPIWTNVNSTEVIDDYTVIIHLKHQYAPFLMMAMTAEIAPKHIWEPITSQPDWDPLIHQPTLEEMVGNGPFKIVNYVPGSYVKYAAFDNFFRGRPYIDELLFPIITSSDTMLMALIKGEIDAMKSLIPIEALPSLLKDEDLAFHVYHRDFITHMGLNTRKFPLDSVQFRKAIAHAIDKEELLTVSRHGYGLPGPWGIIAPVWSFWYNENVTSYDFNLTKGNLLLDEMGWIDGDGDNIRETPDGKKVQFELGAIEGNARLAEIIGDSISQLGVEVDVVIQAWPTLRSRIYAEVDVPDKVVSWISGASAGDPDWLYFRFHSSQIPRLNGYSYNSSEFDNVIEQQGRSMDPEERQSLVYKAQEILADELPAIILFYDSPPDVYRVDKFIGWVKPLVDSATTEWTYMNVRLKELTELKKMSLNILNYPSSTVFIGDPVMMKMEVKDDQGVAVEDVTVNLIISGIPGDYSLETVGSGIYEISLDSSSWNLGPHTMKVIANKQGSEQSSIDFSFSVATPAPLTPPPSPSFWESYGLAIVAVALIIAIIAIAYSFIKR